VKEFEVEDIKSEVSFAQKTLKREEDNLKAFLYDWGFWNDTYYFLQGKGKQAYIDDNLTKDFLLKLPNRCLAYIDTKGKIFYSVYVDHENKKLAPTPKHIIDFINTNAGKLKNKVGLMVFESKVYFVGTQEVLKNDFTGPSTGLFLVVRDYKPAIFENKRPSQLTLQLSALSEKDNTKTLIINDDFMIIHEILKDLTGKPAVLGTATLKRTMHTSTTNMLTQLFIIMTIFSLILSFGILYVVNKLFSLQQKFFHANRLASIGILGAGIAHELNNPLAVISGFAQNIENEIRAGKVSNEEIKESNDKILIHVERMRKIVDQIRVFSRNTATSKGLLKYEDINNVVSESMMLFKKQLEAHNIELNMDLSEKLPKVLMDRTKTESVVQNIVSNAKDELDNLGRDKKKTIDIRTELTEKGKAVTVSITDNGRGVPKELHKHIFDPFYTTKAPGKGTGLGLAISYGIMREINGSISIESEVNKGTTFKVKFPVGDTF